MLLLQSETHWMGTRISYLGEGVLNSYKDFIFRIRARTKVCKNDIFPSIRLGNDIYSVSNLAQNADANSIVQSLHQFLYQKTCVTDGFSLTLEWADKHSWASQALISSLSF